MSTRVREAMMSRLGELRHEPTEKRIRALLGGETVVDSTRALLVWEPRRVVPVFAVPIGDVRAELEPGSQEGAASAAPILHPGIPFGAHSTAGDALDLRAAGETRHGAAFRPADPDLAGYAILDFAAFDAWYEEDERILSHPRDPYHRVDTRTSSRPVRIELDGELIADSSRPTLVFETSLPTRFYLPREDVLADLRPSPKRTYCPYKGEASYWSVSEHSDLAWSYEDPLPDAARLTGLIAFFDDKLDVLLDGALRERPSTPFAKSILEEAGV